MLNIDSIKVNYGKSKIINGITFFINPDNKLVILGRNGVGKTTLLKSIIGLLPLAEGRISFCSKELSQLKPHARCREGIAYVPQGREIIPDFSVRENLELGAMSKSSTDKSFNVKAQMELVLNYFPVLKEHLERKGGVLSGGQQQQLAIARALMSSPRLLLLDEPTEGIQPNIVMEIAAILNRISREMSIAMIIVEQNLKFALKIADRYIIMQKGSIVSSGRTVELTDTLIARYLSV